MNRNDIVRARSTDEYVQLVQQAIDEISVLRQSIEDDGESMSETRGLVDELEIILKDLYQSMKDGTYEFATADLAYMPLLAKPHSSVIHFNFLLKRINETHMKGLEIAK